MFKIDNEKELVSFLKILTEEAVKKTKRSILEDNAGDLVAQSFKTRLKTEKENLYEEEEQEETEMQAGDKEDPALMTPEEETSGDEPPEPEPESSQPEELKASLDALERFINALRAGKSLRDSTVEDQLETYFDRLGDDEKSLLVLFMREVSRILSGKIDGDTAVNPNDEPYNLDVVTDSQDDAPEPEASNQVDVKAPVSEPQDQDDEEEEEEEDTSAPIKVGQPQDLQEIRKKIVKLMRS